MARLGRSENSAKPIIVGKNVKFEGGLDELFPRFALLYHQPSANAPHTLSAEDSGRLQSPSADGNLARLGPGIGTNSPDPSSLLPHWDLLLELASDLFTLQLPALPALHSSNRRISSDLNEAPGCNPAPLSPPRSGLEGRGAGGEGFLNQFPSDQILACKRLPNHRKMYLDYEGDISQNRGSVTRVASGWYRPKDPTSPCTVDLFDANQHSLARFSLPACRIHQTLQLTVHSWRIGT